MMDACFHEGIGPVFYVRLLGLRQALRVSSAETRLTVYCRRVIRVQRRASLDRQKFGTRRKFSILILIFF